MKRIALVIDGPFLFQLKKNYGFNINIFKFLEHLRGNNGDEGSIVIKEYFYDLVPGDHGQNSFSQLLQRNSFRTIPVPLKIIKPGSDEEIWKSRTDQRIAIEIMKYIFNDKFDKLVLVSGDSDFEFLIDEIRQNNKECDVWATYATIATELKGAANNYYLFDHQNFSHLTFSE